jgi:predicted PurR-regulated permease PerM
MISAVENRVFALLCASFLLVAACFFFAYLGGIAFLFFLGIVLAYLFNPFIVRLEARGYRRSRLVLGFYLVVIGGLVLAARILVPLAIGGMIAQKTRVVEFLDVLQRIPADIERDWLTKLPVGSEQAIAAVHAGHDWIVQSVAGLPSALLELSPKLFDLALLPFITYFALVEGPGWVNALIRVCPNRHVEKVVSLVYQIDAALGSYIRGLMLDCLVFGVVTWTALTLLGVDYALEVAVFAGVVNVVPYLGPFSAGMVAAALAFMQFHSLGAVLRVMAAMVAIKFLDDWVFQPAIMRRAVHLHPLLLLFAILAGGQLFGFFGLVFAVPVAATLQAAVQVLHDWYSTEIGRAPTHFSRHVASIPAV